MMCDVPGVLLELLGQRFTVYVYERFISQQRVFVIASFAIAE
jgi:hypothetical protein